MQFFYSNADIANSVAGGLLLVSPFAFGKTTGFSRSVSSGAEYAAESVPKALNPGINMTEKGLAHTLERHTFNDVAKWGGKSKFSNTSEVPGLIRQATQQPMLQQANGNFARIVNAGKIIGIDRATGKSTSIYTVITVPKGNLITAFPGMP